MHDNLMTTKPIRRANMPRGFRPAENVTPTGGGERILPEKQSCYSYHQIEGFKLIDHPLGANADRISLETALERSGFNTEPSETWEMSPNGGRVQYYERGSTVEFLVVIIPRGGLEQYVVAQGFPALLHLLALIRNAGFMG